MNWHKFAVLLIGLIICSYTFLGILKVLIWICYMDIFTVEGIIPYGIPIEYNSLLYLVLFFVGLVFIAFGFSIESKRKVLSSGL